MSTEEKSKTSSLPVGYKRVNFNAPIELMDEFEQVVKANDRSVAWMLRHLIENCIKVHKQHQN